MTYNNEAWACSCRPRRLMSKVTRGQIVSAMLNMAFFPPLEADLLKLHAQAPADKSPPM